MRKQKGDGWIQVPVDKRIMSMPATALWEPGVRCYQKDLADGHLTVLVALNCEPGPNSPRWHLSVSHRTNDHPPQPGRLPDWYEIKEARYKFVPPEVTMALLLPPPEQFVNLHDTTMQLWEIDPR